MKTWLEKEGFWMNDLPLKREEFRSIWCSWLDLWELFHIRWRNKNPQGKGWTTEEEKEAPTYFIRLWFGRALFFYFLFLLRWFILFLVDFYLFIVYLYFFMQNLEQSFHTAVTWSYLTWGFWRFFLFAFCLLYFRAFNGWHPALVIDAKFYNRKSKLG